MRILSLFLIISLFSSCAYCMDENQKKTLIIGCVGGVCAYAGCKFVDWTISKFRGPNKSAQPPKIEKKDEHVADLKQTVSTLTQTTARLDKTWSDLKEKLQERTEQWDKDVDDLYDMLAGLTLAKAQQAVLLAEHHQMILISSEKHKFNETDFQNLRKSISEFRVELDQLPGRLSEDLLQHLIPKKEEETGETIVFKPEEMQTLRTFIQRYAPDTVNEEEAIADDQSSERTGSIILSHKGRRLVPSRNSSATESPVPDDMSDDESKRIRDVKKILRKSLSDNVWTKSKVTDSPVSTTANAPESRSSSCISPVEELPVIVVTHASGTSSSSSASSPTLNKGSDSDEYDSANCDVFPDDAVI